MADLQERKGKDKREGGYRAKRKEGKIDRNCNTSKPQTGSGVEINNVKKKEKKRGSK